MRSLFIGNWIAEETLRTISWTLFHSLWIGLLAAVVSGIIIISTRRSTAQLRYNLLTGVMFLFLVSCGVAFFNQVQLSWNPGKETQDATIITATANLSSDKQSTIAPKDVINEFTQYFNANADILVYTWLLFFIGHCIKLLTGLGGIQRLRNYKTSLPPGEWIKKLHELSITIGIRQSVTLLQSELIKVPVAIGYFKPVILVPLSLLSNLQPEQVEAILLHELAHIRRRDYLMNIIQRFAEAIFFFNPGFIWLCSLIRQEREACCDDIVVATTGENRNYVEALVCFQEYSVTSSTYAMAIRTRQHYLLNRVNRLLTNENKKLNALEKIFLLIGLIIFTAFTIIPLKEEEKKKREMAGTITVVQSTDPAIPVVEFSELVVKNLKDTIPAKNKSEIDFKQISTNVNINDKTRTETITAFDPAGKKYTIVKLNDKITSLHVDDKSIPDNEIGNYSSVINQIDRTIQKKQEHKAKEMEVKKAENEKKKIEQDNKVKEKNKIAATNNKSKEEINKNIEAKRKMIDADRKILDKNREELADVKKEITVKKQELKSKEGKEKDAGLKEIKNKEKFADAKLKEIENRKKVIENKKQEIGDEKEKLEKIKEKENKAREKEEGNGKGEGEGKGEGKGEGQEKVDLPNSKKIFKENSIASRQEIRHTVDRNILLKKNAGYKKAEEYKSVVYGPPAKKAAPQAPGWRAVPSKPVFKNPRTEIPRKEQRIK